MEVGNVSFLTPHMARVTFAGPELQGFAVDQPAASVRLLLPSPGTTDLVIPTWTGNEFLFEDGSRPIIRTFTPRRADGGAGELDLDIVIHKGGAASGWAEAASPGDPAAVSGPARGYSVPVDASGFLLAGDETAIPAISQLLETLPQDKPVAVIVEIRAPDAQLALPHRRDVTERWCLLNAGDPPGRALVDAVRNTHKEPGTVVWAAGEAAAMHRIRRHLFDDLGLARSQATVRGYWKLRHAGTAADPSEV